MSDNHLDIKAIEICEAVELFQIEKANAIIRQLHQAGRLAGIEECEKVVNSCTRHAYMTDGGGTTSSMILLNDALAAIKKVKDGKH